MPLKINLPNGLSVYREVASSPKPVPVVQPDPEPACPMPEPQKDSPDSPVEVVDEVAPPKAAKRGRKPKKTADAENL